MEEAGRDAVVDAKASEEAAVDVDDGICMPSTCGNIDAPAEVPFAEPANGSPW